jgi:hypothetical protein
MSVTPLFNADMGTLKSLLRLSGADQPDVAAVILNAVQKVRTALFDRLGASRIAEVLLYPLTDNATSDNEITRLRAAQTETMWVRMFLLREIPTQFMDGSAGTQETWNEAGVTRDIGASALSKEIARLESEIAENIQILRGGIGQPDNSRVANYVSGGTTKNRAPGSFIYPS